MGTFFSSEINVNNYNNINNNLNKNWNLPSKGENTKNIHDYYEIGPQIGTFVLIFIICFYIYLLVFF